ncbi:MAG: hypothetical protein KDC61_17485, partial [Saprospiraceae bacterium]|nr:hypothetical protein [Saprospiraceae bacterium]
FLPFEDLHYSFSLFTDHTDDDDRLSARLRYFADFLENLVLSDSILLEANNEGEYLWADQEVDEILTTYNLSNNFVYQNMEGVSAAEHSPNIFGPLIKELGNNLEVPVIHDPSNENAETWSKFFSDFSLNAIQESHYSEIKDYVQFLSKKYDLFDEHLWNALDSAYKDLYALRNSYNRVVVT